MENVYIIAAGGTGGHFYPGYALGRELAARGHDVVFVIKKGSQSAKLLDTADLRYAEINPAPMPRGKNPFKWALFALKLLGGIWASRRIIKDYKPVVCIGMGGYISFPLVFTAHYMGIRTVVHDSNAKIGFANRLNAKYADLFLLGLPTEDIIPRAVLAGTPVREEFRLKESQEERNYWEFATDFGINILIFGGSQGAKGLNFAAAQTALDLMQKTQRIHFLHITGARDYEVVKELYRDSPNVEVISYAEDIYSLMKAAHLIIARSGASSLAEIICLKKPSILVPFPRASDNHQHHNAKILADRGCALLLPESEDLSAQLTEAIKKILSTPGACKTMSANFDDCRLPDPLDAAAYSASLIEHLVKK